MSDFLEDAFTGAPEPDRRLSDLLATLKLNRTDIIAQLADRHRADGAADGGLLHALAVAQMAIAALEAERDQW